MSDNLAAGSSALSKEEKKRLKKEKREKKEREDKEVEVPVAEDKPEESKEERRARKAAKKAAKAAAKEVSDEVPAGKEEIGATGGSKSEMKEKRKSKGKEKEENKQEVTVTADDALESRGAEGQAEKGEGEVTSKKDKKDKKDKKRKRDEDAAPPPEASSNATAEKATEPVAAEEQPKKKKKAKKAKGKATSEGGKVEKDGSSGVFADETLSEQAQKALHYVEEHATHHLGKTAVAPGKGWKFNKARQNWLLRHIWSETEVPEKYVEGVMRYLNTMKGAGRAELLNTARKYAAAQGPSAEAAPEGGEDGDAAAEVAGDEVKADGAGATQEVQDAGDAGVGWEARKQRAEHLLLVMESA